MKNSTIEIKIINQEKGETTKVQFSTDDNKAFIRISNAILDIFDKIHTKRG